MRIQIGQQLEDRIERVYKQAGYSRKGDLVREATRKLVNELEAEYLTQEQSVRDAFTYTINRGGVGGPVIRLSPKTDSPIRFKYFSKGNPPHTTILDTGNTYIPEKAPEGSDLPGIVDTLEDIEGVDRVGVLTKGEISVTVKEDNSIPLVDADGDTLVDHIYDKLGELIDEANRRVREGEETRQDAMRRAVKDYWKYSHQIGQ
ncbi:MAG: hypothetical protein ABEI86_09920 [Halobacteriaceae archaeon]